MAKKQKPARKTLAEVELWDISEVIVEIAAKGNFYEGIQGQLLGFENGKAVVSVGSEEFELFAPEELIVIKGA